MELLIQDKSNPSKTWFHQHPVFAGVLGILGFLIVIGLIGNNSGKSTDQGDAQNSVQSTQSQASEHAPSAPPTSSPASSSPSPVPKTWRTVTTVSTSVGTKTESFAIRGTQQRITYNCSATRDINGFWGDLVSAEKGYGGDSFAVDVKCPQSNTSYEYAQIPGQYYLDIRLVNETVTITVEDYY
ncbi:MAG: hypothetical protein HYT39_01690 [Candidatus Sungbacteria bacterium]|nr:hypothetical protein [Candidatus Sungbacteria bacterium]